MTPSFHFDWSMDGSGKKSSKLSPTDASIDSCAGLVNSHARMISHIETCIPDVIKIDQMQKRVSSTSQP